MIDIVETRSADLKGSLRKPNGLQVRVNSVTPHSSDINCYELVDPTGNVLPQFAPGSHVDVSIPGEGAFVRQYSLCGDPEDRQRYLICVQRETTGRGGSKAIFERLVPDAQIRISLPRNNFALAGDASRHLLLAGGIGVTPMISMIHHFTRCGEDFTLHYCTRSSERTAFREMLEPLVAQKRVFIHWDFGDPAKGLNLNDTLRDFDHGSHLYYCGPPGFMAAVALASAHWPKPSVHREFFTPSENDLNVRESRAVGVSSSSLDGNFGPPFQVKIASTGKILDIPSDQTLLNVLRENGFQIETQCELGVCGTCKTRYLRGEVDHRDFVLEEDERDYTITVCCSRSKSSLLVLDL